MPQPLDITGNRFGSLVALCAITIGHPTMWLCRCDCGNEKEIYLGSLRNGTTRSCGCRRVSASKARATHGHRRQKEFTPEYRSHMAAKSRCNNPNNNKYLLYGGRGIEFRFKDFEEFFAELGPRPIGMTLDRIDPNGHYEKGNVRWATAKEQANNRRAA